MTAVPDIQAFNITRRDAFLLLACDGFWGALRRTQACAASAPHAALKLTLACHAQQKLKAQSSKLPPRLPILQLPIPDSLLPLSCASVVFSPQDAVDFAQRETAEKGNDAKQTCNRLIHEAIRERRCKDNCTVMLLQLQHGEKQAPPQHVDGAGGQHAAAPAAATPGGT
jgi:serine/threonine protein phosphatase PrpC